MIKKLVLVLATLSMGVAVSAQTYVRGYVKKDGTYVPGHVRSSPNSTTADNWSTKGNVNPYTGKAGTREPTYTNPYAPKPRKAPCYYSCGN
jgi:hypothetical protein